MPQDARLVTAGVTGTNGKTSTTTLLSAALSMVSSDCPPMVTSERAVDSLSRPETLEASMDGAWAARVTTIGLGLGRVVRAQQGWRWEDEPQDLPMTHAGMQALVKRLLTRGGRRIALEYTSQALAHGYARLWPAQVAVFTNLTHDHLDAHGSPEHYLASKAQLFMHLPKGGTAVLNAADPSSELIAQVVPSGVRIVRYGVPGANVGRTAAIDLAIERITPTWTGTHVDVSWPTSQGRALAGEHPPTMVTTRAIGAVFGENVVAALAASIALGVRPADAVTALAVVDAPAGRFEVVADRPRVVVDYAHTPDALARTLDTARGLAGSARLTVVFGAGGSRDKDKRAVMGLAARRADRVILTSDNPRNEDPAAIAAQIEQGLRGTIDMQGLAVTGPLSILGADNHRVPSVTIELDRARAIALAIETAAPDEVIVIAGKGHERTQVIGGQTRTFSDPDVVRAVLDRTTPTQSSP